jgi:hypothetical protein
MVREVFSSLRNFKVSMDFMHRCGLDAWHGALRTHLGRKTPPVSALDIVNGTEQLTSADIQTMAEDAGLGEELSEETIEQMLAAIRHQVDADCVDRALRNAEVDQDAIGPVTTLVVEQAARDDPQLDEDDLRDELRALSLEELVERALPVDMEEIRAPRFSKFLAEELHPTLHAWVSWAEPQRVMQLDMFARAIQAIKQEQLYAVWPAGARRRLIAMATKSSGVVEVDTKSMMRSTKALVTDEDKASFEIELESIKLPEHPTEPLEVSDDHSDDGDDLSRQFEEDLEDMGLSLRHATVDMSSGRLSYMVPGANRVFTAPAPSSSSRGLLLDGVESAERRQLERAQRTMRQRWRRTVKSMQRNVAPCLAVLLAVSVATFGLVVFFFSSGCCPLNLQPTWEQAGLDITSCKEKVKMRGTSCRVKCQSGYTAKESIKFQCGNRHSWLYPVWEPTIPISIGSTHFCEIDGCADDHGLPEEYQSSPYLQNDCKDQGLSKKCSCRGWCDPQPGGNFTCTTSLSYGHTYTNTVRID